MIEYANARVRYGDREVVRGIDLVVGNGQTTVLLGRSGSGKTTLLKLVNRLLVPSAGDVRVEGRSTLDWDAIELRRRTGYVIQEGGLLPHYDVARNIGLVPELLGWPASRVAKRVRELLELVRLPADITGRYPHQLSGGQRQRVGVARALAADPPLLLCDEPFGALDPITRAELQREFGRLAAGLGKTILFVTHDVREALLLADRIVLLVAGAVEVDAAADEFARSDNAEARAFLASLRDPLAERADD